MVGQRFRVGRQGGKQLIHDSTLSTLMAMLAWVFTRTLHPTHMQLAWKVKLDRILILILMHTHKNNRNVGWIKQTLNQQHPKKFIIRFIVLQRTKLDEDISSPNHT